MDEIKVQTLSELYCLLNYFPKIYLDKIPEKLLDLIKGFCNKKYFIEVDTTKTLEEQNISDETKNMLVVFKYNYWASEYEKQNIIEKLNENEKNYQEELREKYNPDNLFKDNKIQTNEKCVSMVVYKEPIFIKIKNWFKRIL